MDDLKANNVGRSETSGKYEKLISRKTSLQPKIQPRRKSLRRRSHQVEDEVGTYRSKLFYNLLYFWSTKIRLSLICT